MNLTIVTERKPYEEKIVEMINGLVNKKYSVAQRAFCFYHLLSEGVEGVTMDFGEMILSDVQHLREDYLADSIPSTLVVGHARQIAPEDMQSFMVYQKKPSATLMFDRVSLEGEESVSAMMMPEDSASLVPLPNEESRGFYNATHERWVDFINQACGPGGEFLHLQLIANVAPGGADRMMQYIEHVAQGMMETNRRLRHVVIMIDCTQTIPLYAPSFSLAKKHGYIFPALGKAEEFFSQIYDWEAAGDRGEATKHVRAINSFLYDSQSGDKDLLQISNDGTGKKLWPHPHVRDSSQPPPARPLFMSQIYGFKVIEQEDVQRRLFV